MAFLDRICNVCLEQCEIFKAVDENTKSVFDILRPKIDFTLMQGSVMCNNCAEVLTKCFDFKVKCLRTYDYIILFVNKDNVELDLRDVYLSKNETDMDFAKDEVICGLCLGLVKNCSIMSLDVEVGGVTLKKMIEQCLPELDLRIIMKPVICVTCHASLENCFHFVRNCFNLEENIKNCCETVDINSKCQKELNSLSQFTIRGVTASELDGNSVDIINVGEQFCEDRENPVERGYLTKELMSFGDSEGTNEDVKNKCDSFIEINDQKVNNDQQFIPNMCTYEEQSNKLGSIEIEEIFCEENETKPNEENVEMEDQKCLVDEIEIKTDQHDLDRFVNGIILPQSEVIMRQQRREKCVVPNLEGDLSELQLSVHLPSKINIYNCDLCSFQTKKIYRFKKHSLVHKDSSEVLMYKCDSCSFQTKYKCKLKRHSLSHRAVKTYMCDFCFYRTSYETSLKRHSLNHHRNSVITMYKCDSCPYQTTVKGALNRHLLTHKDPSEVTVYKCDSCPFQTRYKRCLARHSLNHKDPSEVTMYKCDSCSYQVKIEGDFKRHLLKHKDPSEVTMYKCDSCSFQSKRRDTLKEHLLRHKDPSEVTMYKCEFCPYQTKIKGDLKKHLLRHKAGTISELKLKLKFPEN